MDPDQLFFECLDPFFHLKTARALVKMGETEPVIHWQAPDSADRNIFDVGPINRAAQLRMIRYVQAETMLSIICSGNSFDPFLKFADVHKNSMYRWFDQISNNIVPDISRPRKSSFATIDNFIEYSIFRRTGMIENIHTYTSFVSTEARFFCNRGPYNSFKHGCAIVGSGLCTLEIEGAEDLASFFNIEGQGMTALRWARDRKSKKEGIDIIQCSTDISRDISRIAISASIVNIVKNVRLIQKTKEEITINVLDEIFSPDGIDRFTNLKIRWDS